MVQRGSSERRPISSEELTDAAVTFQAFWSGLGFPSLENESIRAGGHSEKGAGEERLPPGRGARQPQTLGVKGHRGRSFSSPVYALTTRPSVPVSRVRLGPGTGCKRHQAHSALLTGVEGCPFQSDSRAWSTGSPPPCRMPPT